MQTLISMYAYGLKMMTIEEYQGQIQSCPSGPARDPPKRSCTQNLSEIELF